MLSDRLQNEWFTYLSSRLISLNSHWGKKDYPPPPLNGPAIKRITFFAASLNTFSKKQDYRRSLTEIKINFYNKSYNISSILFFGLVPLIPLQFIFKDTRRSGPDKVSEHHYDRFSRLLDTRSVSQTFLSL